MKRDPGCSNCGTGTGDPCDQCATGTTPAEMSVTASGMADGVNPGEACPCPLGDGTFVCPQTSACEWVYGFDSCDADATYNNRTYTFNVAVQAIVRSGDYITRVVMTITIVGGPPYPTGMVNSAGIFEYNHGTTKPDCSAFSSLSIPYVSQSGGCDFSGVTLTVTSIP